MGIYKIKSISHSGTKGIRGLPRTDGRYHLRVGRTVRLDMEHITVGIPLILEYVKDENGNDYSGYYLRCSIIRGIHFIGDKCGCIETNNTIYEFEKESEGKDNE